VSAIPEVVGPGGILLGPAGLNTVPSGEDQWLPDVDAFTGALEKLYAGRGMRRDLGRAGHEHVTKTFNWDAATASFDEYIKALAALPKGEQKVAVGNHPG
jgi:glycosyltransferase involved in cell wall biosynthesis